MIREFLVLLNRLGIKVWQESGELKIRAPKGVLTPDLRARLAQQKSEILTYLVKLSSAKAAQERIEPVSRNQPSPLSFPQQRLWFLDRLDPGSPAYNLPMGERFRDVLDPVTLGRTLTEIVRRHEGLRTVFPAEQGTPFQKILPPFAVDMPVIDLSGLERATRIAEANRVASREALYRFDLAEGPLVRFHFLALETDDGVFLANLHHIVADAWSLNILRKEMLALYDAFAHGRPSPLDELTLQYGDYAAWQRGRLSSQTTTSQLAYWKNQLGGELPVLNLPIDRPRPAVESESGATFRFALPSQLSGAMAALAQKNQSTLFMVLLAVYKILLSRYSHQRDICIGTPVAGRTQLQTEPLIGFFVNTLVLRSQLSGNPRFNEFLKRVRHTALEAFAHEEIPFEKLVEELQPDRDLGHSPLFQAMFNLHELAVGEDAQSRARRKPESEKEEFAFEAGTTMFDLALTINSYGGAIQAMVEYRTDLFDAGTIERFSHHFIRLLEGIAADPERPVFDLPLLTEKELLLLRDWNHTAAAPPETELVYAMFAAQAARTPHRQALTFYDRTLGYEELNNLANGIAHQLKALGARPETLVAVLMERGVEMVAALLAVLKAGAAYVPMDPAYPTDRVTYMLEDSRAPLLITQKSLCPDLLGQSVNTLFLEPGEKLSDWTALPNGADPGQMVDPNNLAYVIYTSGSTGKPKGVPIPHRALANFLHSMRREPGLTQDDVLLTVTTISFDIAALELYLPLLVGARLVVADRATATDGRRLAETIAAEGVTALQATPATWRLLLSATWRGAPNLKILCGGEAFPSALAAQLMDKGRGLWNLYGPTETTIWSTLCRVGDSTATTANAVSLGRPIDNTQIYLLDSRCRRVPVGVAGELCIGGKGLARGYFERPSLTSERFAVNPFGAEPGARLYRTGDLARFLPDGAIEYLGRMDFQVKLRGFRIELGEIESALSQHQAVRQAVAAVREDDAGEGRLTAYLIADFSGWANEEATRAHISQWEQLWSEAYRDGSRATEPDLNISGWDSSYTGEPIPKEAMAEWASATVSRISNLNPRRVLEIGCGTGMLLFGIAPHCASYDGVDISPKALGYIRNQLETAPSGGTKLGSCAVSLHCQPAHELAGFEPKSFDTIILNSVVQYFPGIDYLMTVLRRVLRLAAPGGRIFFGDLRNFALLEHFHGSIQLHRADDAVTLDKLEQRLSDSLKNEGELLVAPLLFSAVAQRFPEVGHVDLLPRRGRDHNEMTRFRYDAVIHVGQSPERIAVTWLDWRRDELSLAKVRKLLSDQGETPIAIANAPNRRLRTEAALLKILRETNRPADVAGLRRQLAAADQGVDPEELWALGADPTTVDISWTGVEQDGHFNIVFWPNASRKAGHAVAPPQLDALADSLERDPWTAFGNNPLQRGFQSELIPELRTLLKRSLPEYMVPSAFVLLDSMPLTPNGKVDRKSLSALDKTRVELKGAYLAPRTRTEARLSSIWSEVLGVEPIGASDDFFLLGGHSLLGTQLISRIHKAFQLELPLRVIFEKTRLEMLASEIDLRMGSERIAKAPTIPVVSRDQRLPLSFAQQRLWFIDRMDPGNPVYNIPIAEAFTAPVAVDAFENALNQIIRRHEVLRTRFVFDGTAPYQEIHPFVPEALAVIDLTGLRNAERETVVSRLASHEAAHRFNLAQGPLVRFQYVRLRSDRHVLLANIHHIVTDGWSMGLLRRELAAFYEGYRVGEPRPLPELPIQYADFAHWQQQWLRGDALEAQMAYWRQRLGDGPPVLDMPTDRPRPALQTTNGAHYDVALSPELSHRLKDQAKANGATPFMFLLAAYQILLARYSGQRDISVGIPSSGRHYLETEKLIGFFVNTLVLRGVLSGDPRFIDHLTQVRNLSLDAFAHQDIPFEKLVAELQPARDLNHSPLFQVFFNFMETEEDVTGREPADTPETSKVLGEEIDYRFDVAKFDLSLMMVNQPTHFIASFEYNRDLFERTTIIRMADHFQNLLATVVDVPERRVGDIELCSAAERTLVLSTWNETASDYPAKRGLHSFFQRHARERPGAVAVALGDESISYGQLNRKANALARDLLDLGVGPDTPVCVCLDRSIEQMIAFLAILKAGGAYVPLDPTYPEQRLRFIIGDTAAPVVITRSPYDEKVTDLSVTPWRMDQGWTALREHPENLQIPISGMHLAYLIFTSGSTGAPKGVAVTHRGVLRLLLNSNYLTPNRRHITGQVCNTVFDVATAEIWGGFLFGGQLIIIPREIILSPPAFFDLIRRRRITTLHLPTAVFHHLAAADPDGFQSLSTLIFAGEAVNPHILRRVASGKRPPVLMNCYGPTENTVYSSYYPVDQVEETVVNVSIGKPIANTEAYVLDTGLRPQPIGVRGELYLGGDGLARGYLNRPRLTAESFVPHPFSRAPGRRLYRSGDLARFRDGGNIEYLGRGDFQVKVRGFRIELGEIETFLAGHEAVAKAVVLARPGKSGDKQLAAYLEAKQGAAVSAGLLASYLEDHLAAYMIPATFVILDSLPLNTSGKIDRKALAAMEAANVNRVSGERVAPRDSTETTLAAIWSDVLGLEAVGIHDSFFELGGHSLLATQLIFRIRLAFEIELPVRHIFESPTIARLASVVDESLKTATDSAPPPVVAVSRDQRLPLSFAQRRLWFIDQMDPGSPIYNIPLTQRLRTEIQASVLERAVNEIVRRHESLRTCFPNHEDQPYQKILPYQPIDLPLVDLMRLPLVDRHETAQRLAASEAVHHFDLVQGPLIRFRLLRLETEDHWLLINMHHIVSDGWSIGILQRELIAIFDAYRRDEPSPLAEPVIQYADYAYWQQQWLQGAALETQMVYWKQRLGNGSPPLPLATDHPRPRIPTYEGGAHDFQLSLELTRGLRALARQQGCTLFMALLAGFDVLLSRYSGSDDICIGAPIAGRTRAWTENLIGFFVNTLVMRGDLSGQPNFRQLLNRIREVALEAYDHQDLPFEKLVEELQPERDLSHTPLFQVLFNFQEKTETERSEHAIKAAEPVSAREEIVLPGIAKFDLTLDAMDDGSPILDLAFSYKTALFEAATVERMARHFKILLEAMVADPERPVAELSCLDEQEADLILVGWNDTVREYPSETAVHHLFEQRGQPEAAALVWREEDGGSRAMTYGELNARANRLAHYLGSLGVGLEDRIGLCTERHAEMVIALLAILKAGGAYLPLDPGYPSERLATMMADAQVRVILTETHLVERLPSGARIVLLNGERDRRDIAAMPATPPSAPVLAENLAYVMFTSGSTGRPKAIQVSHRNIARLVINTNFASLNEDCVMLHMAPISFDASTLEVWGPLLNGGRVALFPGRLPTVEKLSEALRRYRVNTLWLTAALFNHVVEQDAGVLAGVRQLMAGGEALSVSHVRQAYARLKNTRLINGYGPTEGATFTCCYAIPRDLALGASHVPIGYPVANTRTYILDKRLEPVPRGVEGELFIAGDGLARGYLNRPDLTADRWLPCGHDLKPGARMYRTGDRVLYGAEGCITFLGRTDHQVKIRGFRIEIGEIETVLGEHEAVQTAVVLMREDRPGDKRLIAYVVPADPDVEASAISERLNADLKTVLPEYMAPSAFVLMDALPLSATGKVNRRALSEGEAPVLSRNRTETRYMAPRTPAEAMLCGTWSEVLGVDRVGIHDNFFDLGGHSLLAVLLLSRLNKLTTKKITLVELFHNPTVRGLADLIGEESRRLNKTSMLGLQTRGQKPPFFWVHPIGGQVFLL